MFRSPGLTYSPFAETPRQMSANHPNFYYDKNSTPAELGALCSALIRYVGETESPSLSLLE